MRRTTPTLRSGILAVILTSLSCGGSDPQSPVGPGTDRPPSNGSDTEAARKGPARYGYEIVARYDHDARAYTQGLLWVDGKLYESTGQHGESSVRHVELETGKVLRRRNVAAQYFGEGLAAVGDVLYLLTWKAGKALLYQRDKLVPMSYGYTYAGEGWGLTTSDDGELVMSDGTDVIKFLEPKGMKEVRRISVRASGRPVRELNELEWIDGEIWANIWKRDHVARIDPATGEVTGWIDFSGLLGSYRVGSPGEDVLNGIAYDESTGRIWVTGKRWPYLFEVKVVPK